MKDTFALVGSIVTYYRNGKGGLKALQEKGSYRKELRI
jgi:hypothetical protein